MIQNILKYVVDILHKLETISIRRLIIYAIIIYPIILLVTYKDEISLVITTRSNDVVTVHDLASAQERCFSLRKFYDATSVMLYVYQPASKNKTYKERVIFSSSSDYTPLETTKQLQLTSRSKLLEAIKYDGFAKITAESGHIESSIVSAYNLSHIYVTPIRDNTTGIVIGEVMWYFDYDKQIMPQQLINAGQIFAYDIETN